jgi:hypothetical protein
MLGIWEAEERRVALTRPITARLSLKYLYANWAAEELVRGARWCNWSIKGYSTRLKLAFLEAGLDRCDEEEGEKGEEQHLYSCT